VALFDPAESIEDGKPVREIVPGLLDRLASLIPPLVERTVCRFGSWAARRRREQRRLGQRSVNPFNPWPEWSS